MEFQVLYTKKYLGASELEFLISLRNPLVSSVELEPLNVYSVAYV